MSESFVIRQPAGQRTLALRESYLAICEGDACAAHLLNALERWYAYKLKERDQNRGKNKSARQGGESSDADESLWVRMNAEGWGHDLLNLYNEKTIRTKLALLVSLGYAETRSNPKRKWDRTPQWLFKRMPVQDAVDTWEASRAQPELDPDFEWENDVLVQSDAQDLTHSEPTTECSRTNVRVESVKVPNADGETSVSIRTNVRDNNTDISTQESFTDIQNSGVCNLELNARASIAKAQSTAEATPLTSASYTTTFEATPETAPQPAAPSTPTVAVLSPDGDAANAALADIILSDQDFDELFQEPVVNQATSPENVPPAAPRADDAAPRPVEAPTSPSVEHLAPVPQEELLSRVPALLTEETYRAIRPLVGGEFKMSELLAQLTPSGGIERERWLRLTPAEVATAKLAAQAGAKAGQGSMITLAIRALDRLIGAPVGKAGKAETVALPTAYMTAEERRANLATLPTVAEGSFWKCNKTGETFEVWSVSDVFVSLSSGADVPRKKFRECFEQVST